MSTKVMIGHAVCDETGGTAGKQPGDQKGNEITTRKWYKSGGGWTAYLECKDDEMAERAAENMEAICKNDAFGYSQKNRWAGYKSIKANKDKIDGASGDFDCSSLVISCYILAGLKHAASGYTGSMINSFKKTGKFDIYTDSAHLNSPDYAKRGGVYVRSGGHAAMVLTNGSKAEIDISDLSDEDIEQLQEEVAVNNRDPYILVKGSVRVRKMPDETSKTIYISHKGNKLTYLGETETDEDGNEWHFVKTPKGDGYISAFTNKKKKYTELIGAVNEENFEEVPDEEDELE